MDTKKVGFIGEPAFFGQDWTSLGAVQADTLSATDRAPMLSKP